MFNEHFLKELKPWKEEILKHTNNRYSLRALKSLGTVGSQMSNYVCSNYEPTVVEKCKEQVLECCNEYTNNLRETSTSNFIMKYINLFLMYIKHNVNYIVSPLRSV